MFKSRFFNCRFWNPRFLEPDTAFSAVTNQARRIGIYIGV